LPLELKVEEVDQKMVISQHIEQD